jgi:hypothetical protein
MDNKDHVSAASALIRWFNSQEISPSDAEIIMGKCLAVSLVDRHYNPMANGALSDAWMDFQARMGKEMLDRQVHVARKRT